MIIREMIPEDWDRVFEIYKQGINSDKTTFSTNYPSWEEWDAEHNKCCRFVALFNNEITGFTALSPVSKKLTIVESLKFRYMWAKNIGTTASVRNYLKIDSGSTQ